MKKSLLFILLFASTTSWGQQKEAKVKFDRDPINQQKDVVGGWYNYGMMLSDAGGDVDYYRNHLFPDSTVQVEFSSGMGAVWKHGMGQVFDPAGDNWTIGGIIPVDLTDEYTVDTVRIWYQYHRHQTDFPDTLKIQVYNESAMTLQEDPWSSGQSYAIPDYDYTTNSGINAAQEYTVLLDIADTVTSGQRSISIPINMLVAPDEIMSVTVAYAPGNPFNVGDTIDQYMTTPPVNKINAFLMYDYSDNDLNSELGFYNHGLVATQSIRYNINANGWNGGYHPGIAYFNYTDHNDIDFHVVGTLKLDEKSLSDFKLYPNPAQEIMTIEVNEGVELDNIQILDLSGKDVTSMVSISGNSINVSGLANGNYLLKNGSINETTTKNFTVNH